jgi:DNA replication protein DnaC
LHIAGLELLERECRAIAAALVSELIEARDEKKLRRFQKQVAAYELFIVDELWTATASSRAAVYHPAPRF